MKIFGKILLSFLFYFIVYIILEWFIDQGIVSQLVKSGENQQTHKILNDYWLYYSVKNFICMGCSIIISIELLKFPNKSKAYYLLIGMLSFYGIAYISIIHAYSKMFEVDIKYLTSILLAYIGSGVYFHKHLLFKKKKSESAIQYN